VRLRLTALYGALFLLCGAGLLAITNVLVRRRTALPKGSNGVIAITKLPGASPSVSVAPGGGQPRGHTAQAGATAVEHSALLHQLLIQSGIALAVMAAASILLGWLVAGRVLRPLHTITTTVQQISATNLHRRLALGGPDDELKALGMTFDDLLARLEASFEAQRRFVANASHELRTPLTMMRTALDVATGKPRPPTPEVEALATKIRRGLDQADLLLESFLLLARAEHAPLAEDITIDVDYMAAAALAARSEAIATKGLAVEHALGSAPIRGNEALLAQMVGNLIENAIRHNHPGGWIRIVTEADGALATLVVESGGPVLDQHEVSALAEPFRRLGAERTGSDNGVGLGLSIVAAVVVAHHGNLDLQARSTGGLRVVVTLPLAQLPTAVPA
jgi:signal transduction histidine kinase